MLVQPYLFFNGVCEEAVEFYRNALGAEVTMLMRYKEAPPEASDPECPMPAGTENKIMHASFKVGDSLVMASDGRCEGKTNFDGFALSISVSDAAKAKSLFAALSKDGQVRMPLGKTFFAPSFGMVADRFGVLWMIIAEH